MSNEPVRIEGDVGEQLMEILDRLNNPGPMLEQLGRLGQQSVRRTFDLGGRPNKWAPPKYREGQRGRDTGRLMNSFSRGMPGEIFELGQYRIAFGTNVEYAATQNFGAKKGEYGSGPVSIPAHSRETKYGTVYVRGHQRIMQFPWGDIPALNFLTLHPEDVEDFAELVDDWIMSGKDAL